MGVSNHFLFFVILVFCYHINCHPEPKLEVGLVSVLQNFRDELCFLVITTSSVLNTFAHLVIQWKN